MSADPLAFLGTGWAFPVLHDGGDVALVSHDEDVRRAVLLVLATAPGERAMRPDFGCRVHDLVFEPISTTTATLARHHVEQALVTWEPRIDRVTITVTPEHPGTLRIEVGYRVRGTNTFYNLVYPFHLQEGAPR